MELIFIALVLVAVIVALLALNRARASGPWTGNTFTSSGYDSGPTMPFDTFTSTDSSSTFDSGSSHDHHGHHHGGHDAGSPTDSYDSSSSFDAGGSFDGGGGSDGGGGGGSSD